MSKRKKDFSRNSIQTRLLTWFSGEYVGEDEFGNRYYQEKLLFGKFNRRLRRWVLYKDEPEASRIPASWFGWIHFTHEHPLLNEESYAWEKPHQENLTGTIDAYFPSSHRLNPTCGQGSSKRYESWHPPSNLSKGLK